MFVTVLFGVALAPAAAAAPPPVAGGGSVDARNIGNGPLDRVVVQWNSDQGAVATSQRTTRLASAVPGLHKAADLGGDATAYWVPPADTRAAAIADLHSIAAVDGVDGVAPDVRVTADLVPNDSLYAANQSDLFGTWGIDAPAAWDTTTGSSSVTVAVLDTGITTHTEFTGRVLAGYDFISDSQVANDGDGRDANPADPGDWVTTLESATGYFKGCPAGNSSWHGTHVAGTIGARGNNGAGVAGIAWETSILPVRVLGKCGGYLSDITAAMRWAAGGTVPGVPGNPNPARVLSLSLGGAGACDSTTQGAIDEAIGNGAVVVVAAGNSNADLSGYTPASCSGVIAVAATTSSGTRASFSNYGTGVTIAAPGVSIASTWNDGSHGPGSQAYALMSGTSMATPHVSGVAALALAVDPTLTPAELRSLLVDNVKAFAPDGTSSSCQTLGCGAGILDAGAVVTAIGSGTGELTSIVISPDIATIAAGDTQTYTAEGFDADANSLGDVTGNTVFTIDGAGTCSGPDCGSDVPGDYTVTGTTGAFIDNAALTVTPVIMVGAGDIADCTVGAGETAALINGLPTATVFTLGDNAYSTGSITEYTNCYEPSWGAFKSRTYPSMGNHDAPNQATGYFPYFSATPGGIGSPDGYYSYDQDQYWHVIVLNSEISYEAGSAQELWLRADLAANTTKNVVAYWHKPRFSSDDTHGTEVAAEAIWDDLYEFGADLVLNGHAHWYERFAPQTPYGVADATYGIRQFTVGTGGIALRGEGTIDPNSEVRDWSTWGVLKLTLNQSSYDWEFLAVAGSSFTDSGTGTVHGAPGSGATLASIDVTPANPMIAPRLTQQFSATGTYTDASTADLTGSVAWASDTPATATISTGGLATALTAGTSTIRATVGSISGTTTLTVAAPATHTVSGTVTADGTGVDGAVVWAFKASDGSYVSGVVAGAGGSYSLPLAPDSYKLWITNAPGYPDQAYGPDGTFGNATVVDLTTTDQPGTDIVLTAPATHTVSGTVTADGTGVDGAVVWAFKASDGSYVSGVVAGAGGSYSLPLAPDSYKLWITNAPGYPDQAYGPDGTFGNATVVDLTTTDQPGTDIVLTAPATHTVSGTVTADGTGVDGAVVWAFKASDGSYVSGVVAGAGGSYSLPLAPDSYKLWITNAPGYPDQAYGPDGTFGNATVVDLTTTDQPGTDIVLTAPATHTVSGTVTADGTGVDGAVVWAFKASDGSYVSGVVAGAGGSYSLPLAPDSYKLWITNAPGYPDQAYGPDGTFGNATVVDLTTTDQPGTDIVLTAGP